MDFKELREEMIISAEENIGYLSNQNKRTRELSVCAAFLRCIDEPFRKDDLLIVKDDPPDIRFNDANFEIKEVMDEGRKRHTELKQRVEVLRRASEFSDIVISDSPKDITLAGICNIVTNRLMKSAQKYGDLCSSLDVLVYVNLAVA